VCRKLYLDKWRRPLGRSQHRPDDNISMHLEETDTKFVGSQKKVAVSLKTASNFVSIRGGGDKSLARPRKKQATATKLGIYSTYSPRSSIHFLACCSNFCKPLKKTSPSNQVSAAAVISASEEKWLPFNCFFQSKRTGGSPTGPDPENRVGDQDIGSPGRPSSSGLQVPGGAGTLSCKNKTSLVTFPQRFSFKISFNCTSRDE